MKNKKFVWVGLVLVLGLLFYFSISQSVMGSSIVLYGSTITPIHGELDFLGKKASYDTTWLGVISSGDMKNPADYGIQAPKNSYSVSINDVNDAGQISLSNAYSINGNTITLTSTTSSVSAVDSYIAVTLNLSKGNISGSCTDKQTSASGQMLSYACGIEGKQDLGAKYPYGTPKNTEYSETQNFNVEVDGLTTIYTKSIGGTRSSETTTASFTYTPAVITTTTGNVVVTIPNQPSSNNAQIPSLGTPQSKITTQGWIIIGIIVALLSFIIYRRFKK